MAGEMRAFGGTRVVSTSLFIVLYDVDSEDGDEIFSSCEFLLSFHRTVPTRWEAHAVFNENLCHT